jgi:hypothetical protein
MDIDFSPKLLALLATAAKGVVFLIPVSVLVLLWIKKRFKRL